MAASTAYAQIFSRLGLLGSSSSDDGDNDTDTKNKIVSVATTSGSSWFSAQFFFSSQYYDAIVNGTPESLGEFTEKWLEAYGMYVIYLLFLMCTCLVLTPLFCSIYSSEYPYVM